MLFAQIIDLRECSVPLLSLCVPGHRADLGVLMPDHEILVTVVQATSSAAPMYSSPKWVMDRTV